jgi:hypothetical protein
MFPAWRTEGEGFAIPTFALEASDVEGFMDALQEFQSVFRGCLTRTEHCIADTLFFSHDCNIFRTITPDGTSPMQYLLPHTRVVGYPTGLGPDRPAVFMWTRTIGLVQEEAACAFFCWNTAVYDGDGSRSVDAESLTKR